MKKNMFVLAGLVSALALVGCGKKEEAPTAPATPPAASAPAPAPAPAPQAPAAAPAVTSDLPPACESYIKDVENYIPLAPEDKRAELSAKLTETRNVLKSIPDVATQESTCNEAAEMFKQMTAGAPKQ